MDGDYWNSGTVPFGGVYGPAGGNGGSSDMPSVVPSMGQTMFGLEVPTLIALAFLTWWIIKTLD